jgi:hypothetical protein
MIYGHYRPAPIKYVLRCILPRVIEPMECEGGGLADAIYRYERRHDDGKHHVYRLESVQEYMPPRHPSLNIYDNNVRLTMMRPDGTVDLEAEAIMRRREWAQMGAVADDPFEDEGDDGYDYDDE